MEGPKAGVLATLEKVDPSAELVETVRLPVNPAKTHRFEEWAAELAAETRKLPGLQTYEMHSALEGDAAVYFLYEVWEDRDALRRLWESDFLMKFQGQLQTEQLLVGEPDLGLFLRHA